MQEDEIIIDGARLRRVFRRQARLWVWLGPLAAGALLLLLSCVVPRSFTASASVALQQASGGGSALALLTGGAGGTSKRYLGVLKSRALAETVERHVRLTSLYASTHKFRTEEEAAEFLTKAVKPDDSGTDGLLYVSVTLPGPARIAARPSPSAAQVEAASADAANAYTAALKEYYATSDTDQGAALLRGADKEIRQARANYDAALARVLNFSRGLSRVDPRAAPAASAAVSAPAALPAGGGGAAPSPSARPSGDTADAATASAGLGALYQSLGQVQVQLRAAQAARQTGQALVGQQLRDLTSVPADDPLLADARGRVTQDRAAYETASRLYGPENPRVVEAQTQLGVDRAALAQQVQGVKRDLTTPNIRSTEQIRSLYAQQAVLTRQIAQAERRLGVNRRLSGEYGRLQAEVGLQYSLLGATLNEAEKVKLDNASSLSRMTVIDTALPPKSGEPTTTKLAAICLALALLAFAASLIGNYLRAGARDGAASPEAAANGTGGRHGAAAYPSAPGSEEAAGSPGRKK